MHYHCDRGRLSPGAGEGEEERKKGAQTETKGHLALASSSQTQKNNVYPSSGGGAGGCVWWGWEDIPSQDRVCCVGSIVFKPGTLTKDSGRGEHASLDKGKVVLGSLFLTQDTRQE